MYVEVTVLIGDSNGKLQVLVDKNGRAFDSISMKKNVGKSKTMVLI